MTNPVIHNLHKLRMMCSDRKNQWNEPHIFDDDYYILYLEGAGLNPFAPYVVANERTLKQIRIQVFLDIAGDEELVRRVQESVSEQGDWDIHKHIKMLRFDISTFAEELYR